LVAEDGTLNGSYSNNVRGRCLPFAFSRWRVISPIWMHVPVP